MAALLVAALVLLVLFALAVPVRLDFAFEGIEGLCGRLEVGWLFGLVRLRFRAPGRRPAAREPATASAAPRRTERARRREGASARRALALLRQPGVGRRVVRLMRDLVAAAHPRHLRLWLRLGLGDPADTGRVWALLGPVGIAARALHDADVRVEPEFAGAVLEFRAGGSLSLVPLQLLALALGFVLSPVTLRAWRAAGSGHG